MHKILHFLQKNSCNSLISLKIGECYLSKLGDAFRYAVRLEHFAGDIWDEENDLVGFQFPLNTHSLSIRCVPIWKFYIARIDVETGDCKLLVTFARNCMGLIALAKGCTNSEYLKVSLGDISNEALEQWAARHWAARQWDSGNANGLQQTRKARYQHGELTDVGLEYIGKYGANWWSLSLTHTGKSNARLVKLSEGCPRLRKLKLWNCPFSKQVVATSVFNIPTLRQTGSPALELLQYMWSKQIDKQKKGVRVVFLEHVVMQGPWQASCIFVFKLSIKLSLVTRYKNSPTHRAFNH
ncbi:leucine-rich repeat, cysteine-containing subtype protein [Tanacetum coccineum]|uniref:Leucine-rich repeat, cysteine-containing subtype protein n=1 Tax=Tanacetum coccineum TaxID=301880 RepID=A0ABQ5I9U6_9ASTR